MRHTPSGGDLPLDPISDLLVRLELRAGAHFVPQYERHWLRRADLAAELDEFHQDRNIYIYVRRGIR